jgi:ubiquinone/menaquinone biosynthesis C-methylase UbiE
MQYSKEESKAIWNQNAEFWDCAMGDESNDFHREVVRPKVTELLNPDPTDYILDIACGNGNYSAYLAEKAVSVLAFDYSEKMVELAKKRQKRYADHIEFCVADATNETSLMALKRNKPFTKAVSNMAVMDITDIKPLFTSVYKLLEDNGVFVFATQHPCFVTLTEKYMTPMIIEIQLRLPDELRQLSLQNHWYLCERLNVQLRDNVYQHPAEIVRIWWPHQNK